MRSHAQAVSGQKVMTPQMQSIHWEEGSFSAGVILCGGHSLREGGCSLQNTVFTSSECQCRNVLCGFWVVVL